MTAPEVSVIVPVYNGASLIGGCLGALDRQTLEPERYEVIVVDDGSADDTAAVAESVAATARARMTVVRQPANAGPAAARNAGLRVARAPVIAFTDADCEPAPDWLARGLERLRAEPDLAGVEGRTEPKGEPGTLTHQMRNVTGGLWMTCNMFYKRDALEQVGGFDERFRLAFLEDSDVAFAVQAAGGRIAWEPEALVEHLVLPEGRRKFMREARKRFYNPLLFSKHPDMYRAHLAPVVPGLPGLHLRYMAAVVAPLLALAVRLPGLAVLLTPVTALYLRRVAHAYRARDPVSIAQAAAHPFVQTYWVLRGAARFRSFSPDI